MNERIEQLIKQAGFQSYITTHKEDVAMFEKFAELLLKESFTITKAAMVDEDMLAVDEVIADRLDEAAYDVCDQLGLMGPIYEG